MAPNRELTWAPRNEEERAYFGLNAAQQNASLGLFRVFVEPFLTLLGLYRTHDPTYGRAGLPLSPSERALRNKPRLTCRDGKVYITKPGERGSADSTKSAHSPLHSTTGDAWIAYQVWVDEDAARKSGRNADLLYCHGINDYSGKFSRHAQCFLDAGYRLILPDLPSHGRSSGLHSYVTSMALLADAVHAVVCDVLHHDQRTAANMPVRRLFAAGQSAPPSSFPLYDPLEIEYRAGMGGFAAISYALKYPEHKPQASPYALVPGDGPRPTLAGVMVLCPMLDISPETRPSLGLEYIARCLASFAGRLPFAAAHKGNETDDPNVHAEFDADPMGYHGDLRIATGLAILAGILEANERLHELTMPLKIFHGTKDRVTNVAGSKKLYVEASSKDKDLRLLDSYEHIILAEGRDEEDDQRRQRVLKEMLEWLNAHS